MKRPINIQGQFGKLFPSYSRCIDLTEEQMLSLVQPALDRMASLGSREPRRSCSYCLPTHQALIELRDALKEAESEVTEAAI